jgi:ATP-binding cassette subfamily B protein
MEYGEVVEQGTHEDLLDKNGVYAGLWQVQTGVKTAY